VRGIGEAVWRTEFQKKVERQLKVEKDGQSPHQARWQGGGKKRGGQVLAGQGVAGKERGGAFQTAAGLGGKGWNRGNACFKQQTAGGSGREHLVFGLKNRPKRGAGDKKKEKRLELWEGESFWRVLV